MLWFWSKGKETVYEPNPLPKVCLHRWRMFGSTSIGFVTCERCGIEDSAHRVIDEMLDKHQPK
jgi:hypothetical protein